MFSIRSKVQNATPLPSYNNYKKDTQSSQKTQSNNTKNKSRIKKKRKKKRRASEVVNLNDYPSAKRRRISIIGVDVDPKTTKEIIQNKDFLLCEYHSNFPQFLVNELKNIPTNELYQKVSMKSCANQWIISKIITPNNKIQIVYWNTSSIYNNNTNNTNNNNNNISDSNHPNSPSKCYMIENKCIIYNRDINTENNKTIIDISHINDIHLLYPSASSFSTLKAHKPHYNNHQSHQTNHKYHNPFMPYAFNKKNTQNTDEFNDDNDIDLDEKKTQNLNDNDDDSILCPLFPSSTSRSITSISGIIFLSADHTALYVIPHDHVTTINNENGGNQIMYGVNRNITYKIPLLTNIQYNERITSTQILPQPRVGTHHSLNTYKILMGTTHGRLFYITLILNKNGTLSKPKHVHNDNIYFGGDGTDLSSKLYVKDHELLFAFSNDENQVIPNNVGWLGYVVSKIKIGANVLSQVTNNTPDQLQLLKSSGLRYDINIGITAMCFGLNQNCTKIIGYTLRKQCIDCIEFTDKEYNLLWTFSLQNILNPHDETLCMSLLGQGLSILTGYIDAQYGHAITVTLFKINTVTNVPLITYKQSLIQLPAHIHIEDLNTLQYQSFWSYYYDKNDGKNENDVPKLHGLGDLSFLQRQASMAEFVEQRQDERKNILQGQHSFVAPFGMIYSGKKEFITVFPLFCMDEEDEIWTRIRDDYQELYDMNLENNCGPDGEHFNNNLVTTFEAPFYGGGCMLLPYFFHGNTTGNMDMDMDIKIKQLSGGGYGYFMNEKYQIMRMKYSINSAMAHIHSDIEYYQKQQKEEEGKRIKMNIRLAFSEYRNGNQGKPRAHRLSHKLINEDVHMLSTQICMISESILNLKLFDTFSSSNIIQSSIKQLGFDTNKMRLGINQIYIKLQTYDDYIDFLKQSPCSEEGQNLWHFLYNQKKCDVIQHREYLQIAHELYKYFTNNQDDNDHYGQKQNENEDSEEYDSDGNDGEEDIDTVDSRSSLSNFGDSNHNMYRQKYFCLKHVFVPKLLQCVIGKRGDIEYINTFGNDENDTFFMKIGQLQQILTELPTFLKLFLSHLTEKYCNKSNEEEVKYNIHFNEEIAVAIKDSNIMIQNEKDELVYQLITIRISFEIFQCIMNSAQGYRMKNKTFIAGIFKKYNRILWNYNNYMRHISIQLCKIIVPFMHKIRGLMSTCSSSLHSSRSYSNNTHVIDTDNNYYDYILKKEKNEIYRNLNEISRMIMESYKKELSLTQHQYQDSSAYDAINKNFITDRAYLIGNLYDLFPRNTTKQSLDRWKTDLVKDSVNKIAFDYGDCKYLVSLCDFETMNVNIQQVNQQENIFNICIQRFIDNLKRYKHKFMRFYFIQHQDNINSFLCIDIRQSEVWKTYKNNNNDNDIDMLLNECISRYINDNNHNNLSIIDEYSWIHDISVGNYTHTATQLFKITSDDNINYNNNLDQQTVSLSIAKLSVFMDENKENDIDCVQQELLWMNAKLLLRTYSPHKFENEKVLKKMSKVNIMKNLIKESLLNHQQNGINLQHMEQILSLIFNFEPCANINELNHSALIVFFIENVINCNKKEWDTLDLMIEPKNRAQDTSMYQIINRTVIFDITKYLFNRKNQAKFLENSHNIKNMNIYQEDHLWELWSLGVNYSTTNKPDSKYYYAVRTLAFAQSPMI